MADNPGPARLTWRGADALPASLHDHLLGPGAPFELTIERDGERELTIFVRRPHQLRDLLEDSARANPDNPFLVTADRTWTFAEAVTDIDAIARLLVDRYGIGRGDRVGIVAANTAEYGLTIWAVLSVGAIVTSLNGWWTGPELAYGIELTSPKLIVGDEPRLARLSADMVPSGVSVLTLDELHAQAVSQPDRSRPAVDIAEHDPAVILFTSGTTGRPKGATLSHRNIANFALTSRYGMAIAEHMAGRPLPQGANILASPMFHVSGLVAILMTGGALGAKLVVAPPGRWDAGRHLALTREHGITTWSGVPTQWWRLLRHEDFDPAALRGIGSVGGGGAPFPPELVRTFTEVMPWAVLGNGYGMSETVGIGTRINSPAMVQTPESVGPANMTVEVEIRDPDGEVLAEGEIGEIHMRTPSVFLGYWHNPAATDAVLDPAGWYRTGDFGRIEHGMLFLESRMRDLIIRGGENIYPQEVENRLIEHPQIDDAAVIGVDHPELGQEVKAFVVRSAGSALTAGDVHEWAAAALARFKVPAHVEFRDALPYTETGKVLKHLLERDERASGDTQHD